MHGKQLIVKITRLKDQIPPNEPEVHNLRRLQPKNHLEESISDCPINIKKKNPHPIYHRKLSSEPNVTEEGSDMYEEKSITGKLTLSEMHGKQLIIKITRLKDQIPPNEPEVHNLRRLQPKNYLEESISDCPINIKKKNPHPIYHRKLSSKPKVTEEGSDMYEFIDTSPKFHKTRQTNRQRKSSILFDKTTYDILKKLEEKETKAKRKVARKENKLRGKKSYNEIIDKIVSKVSQKILKTKNIPVRTTDASGTVQLDPKALNNNGKVPIGKTSSTISKVPQIIHINNFQEETNVIANNNINASKGQAVPKQFVPSSVCIVDDDGQSDNYDILNNSDGNSILLTNIDCIDNSVLHSDIESCFGFDDVPVPCVSTLAKPKEKPSINIINNVVVRRGVRDPESPFDFNSRRPNANSTMIHTRAPHSTLSPWRTDWVNVRYNPHFVSVKDNALPRLNQEMVMDHTFVECFESDCSKTPRKLPETPLKKATQQSILDFVSSNVEKENEVVHQSLFDSEVFNSPKKKRDAHRVQQVGGTILGDVKNIVSSTPNRRKPLADISNSSGEVGQQQNAANITYFGFDDTLRISPHKRPAKHRKDNGNSSKENDENYAAKPSRFDIDKLKSYSKKYKKPNKQLNSDKQLFACEDQDKSVSIFEASNEESVGEIHLFEEPEEMLDTMSPVHLKEKKLRRKRLKSCDSDESVCENRKRHKKTKLEIDRDMWIKDFNKICDEIDEHELDLE